jgi:hypothetical protein
VALQHYISHHAKARLNEMYTIHPLNAATYILEEGEPIETEMVLAITGRKVPEHPITSKYILSPDYRGILVIEGATVVTVLRMGEHQQEILRKGRE